MLVTMPASAQNASGCAESCQAKVTLPLACPRLELAMRSPPHTALPAGRNISI